MQADIIRDEVRKTYGEIAKGQVSGGCCNSGAASSCCGPTPSSSRALGYSDDDLASVPEGADLGLGCGNPQAIASLKAGERVLDLGSGAGFDAFLAARQVGPEGRVIGVDMTPEMIAKARRNAATVDLTNVDFRLGEIEHLPVPDASVDVIMSNCVINLSPDKPAVFREAFRVLAPGGRLAISDVVAFAPLPEALARDMAAYAGCVSGAALVADVEQMLTNAGFTHVGIDVKGESRELVSGWMPGRSAEDYVASALIQAVKPHPTKHGSDTTIDTADTAACCDSVLLTTCCEPSQKESCCGVDHAADHGVAPRSCGCRTSADTGVTA
jgi:arsenite methyltransferase